MVCHCCTHNTGTQKVRCGHDELAGQQGFGKSCPSLSRLSAPPQPQGTCSGALSFLHISPLLCVTPW